MIMRFRHCILLCSLITPLIVEALELQPDFRRHQLLILVERGRFTPPKATDLQKALPAYQIRELAASTQLFKGDLASGQWFIATPTGRVRLVGSPWDEAYDAAKKLGVTRSQPGTKIGGAVYVEPNIESAWPTREDGDAPLAPDWPNGPHFAWHLDDDYTELSSARTHAKVGGCIPRITILDTGIDAAHSSKPRYIQMDMGRNFFDGEEYGFKNVNDPGDTGWLKNPGHGTGTLGILAGGKVLRSENPDSFEGDLGGAPDAQIVPVRISDSVVHFWTIPMFEGLSYAATLVDAGTGKYCDVISISAGGLPSRAWADAVNTAYEKGIVIVAAAGNNFGGRPTHFSVYPSRFSRVVAAIGVMANFKPYLAPERNAGELQGNYGPRSVMLHAVAAYTPNIPWAKIGTSHFYRLNGAGTSAATPQIAAAFALWLQSHAVQDDLPPGFQWIEASMKAIFSAADKHGFDDSYRLTHFGNGLLKANKALQLTELGPFTQRPRSRVSFPFWRIIFGLPEDDDSAISNLDRMHELEVLQLALQSELISHYTGLDKEEAGSIPSAEREKFLNDIVKSKDTSRELRRYLLDVVGRSRTH